MILYVEVLEISLWHSCENEAAVIIDLILEPSLCHIDGPRNDSLVPCQKIVGLIADYQS